MGCDEDEGSQAGPGIWDHKLWDRDENSASRGSGIQYSDRKTNIANC